MERGIERGKLLASPRAHTDTGPCSHKHLCFEKKQAAASNDEAGILGGGGGLVPEQRGCSNERMKNMGLARGKSVKARKESCSRRTTDNRKK